MDEKEYRKQIADLLIKNQEMGKYIQTLEAKLNDLESELYFIKRNRHMEETMEQNQKNQEIEQGLKQMGLNAEDMEELCDLLDEVIGDKDNKKNEG